MSPQEMFQSPTGQKLVNQLTRNLLQCLLKRIGGKVTITVQEVDDANRKVNIHADVATRAFHLEIKDPDESEKLTQIDKGLFFPTPPKRWAVSIVTGDDIVTEIITADDWRSALCKHTMSPFSTEIPCPLDMKNAVEYMNPHIGVLEIP